MGRAHSPAHTSTGAAPETRVCASSRARELKTQRPRLGKTQSQKELSSSLRGTVTQRQQHTDIDRHSETRKRQGKILQIGRASCRERV